MRISKKLFQSGVLGFFRERHCLQCELGEFREGRQYGSSTDRAKVRRRKAQLLNKRNG